MRLEIGEYEIPEDCTAKVYKGIVYVAPKLPKGRRIGRTNSVKHCRDCLYRVDGYACNTSTRKTKVCKLRPKIVWNWYKKRETYYAAEEYGTICKFFKDKNERLWQEQK